MFLRRVDMDDEVNRVDVHSTGRYVSGYEGANSTTRPPRQRFAACCLCHAAVHR